MVFDKLIFKEVILFFYEVSVSQKSCSEIKKVNSVFHLHGFSPALTTSIPESESSRPIRTRSRSSGRSSTPSSARSTSRVPRPANPTPISATRITWCAKTFRTSTSSRSRSPDASPDTRSCRRCRRTSSRKSRNWWDSSSRMRPYPSTVKDSPESIILWLLCLKRLNDNWPGDNSVFEN